MIIKSPLKMRYHSTDQHGFTLIELLIVIGILAILMGIVLIAINPARQFQQANDSKRRADVLSILNAIGQYESDNNGNLPAAMNGMVPDTLYELSDAPAVNPKVDICATIVPTYIAALPVDPLLNSGNAVTNCSSLYDTGYQISVSATANRVTIQATAEIPGVTITVTR